MFIVFVFLYFHIFHTSSNVFAHFFSAEEIFLVHDVTYYELVIKCKKDWLSLGEAPKCFDGH